jgi:hypothetical protein
MLEKSGGERLTKKRKVKLRIAPAPESEHGEERQA